MASKVEVVRVIKLLADAYPARKFENLNGYVQTAETVLRNIDGKHLEAAAVELIATSKWFPSLAELRERASAVKTAQVEDDRVFLARFVREIQRFERLRPEDWTKADHQAFAALMGRPVDFENDSPDAPWMWWSNMAEQ